MTRKSSPFYLLAFSILIILVLPTLFREGMFIDAMLYISVAKNMANGFGTFWFPQFSHCNMHGLSSFHEQPPLGFGLESLFFRVLGNSMYTERIYTFVIICITVWLIISIWKESTSKNNLQESGWLPVILWISIPVCFWTYSNSMLEVTMTVFILLSGLNFIKYKFRNKFYFLILSGVGIFLASFTKGIPGLFPLSMPFVYWLCMRTGSVKKMVTDTLLLLAVPLIIYLLVILIPDGRDSLSLYLFKRAFQRINDVPTVDSRFYILYRLLLELIVPIAITLILVFTFRIKFFEIKNNKLSHFFLLLGFMGSIPLILTKVQKGFYFVPSLPFFAIGFALLVAPAIQSRINNSSASFSKFFSFGAALIFLTAVFLTFNSVGKFNRDRDLLHDVNLIGKNIPEKEIMTIPDENWNEWSLQCYLIRYYTISVDIKEGYRFMIVKKENDTSDHPGYKKILPESVVYNIYEKV